MFDMRRRDFITLLGGAAAWPLAARAQQPAVPVIGWVHGGSAGAYAQFMPPFHEGLRELGYIEGQNVAIHYRWVEGHYERLPDFIADLVRREVSVIFAFGTPVALAAKAATTTIPIVFEVGGDPVALELVTSFNRPGGNLTGVSLLNVEVVTKRLELLHEMAPTADLVALLVNPNNPRQTEAETKQLAEAAHRIGLRLQVLNASSEGEFDAAFASLQQQGARALIVQSDPMFTVRHDRLVTLAARYAIPTIYGRREFVESGGLMSYADNLASAYRQVGIYVGRILKGDRPADLPVMQPTKFELVINLKTAKALGLTVLDKLLAVADEVIE
jgi:putative ABC transport system substrate-binding protein